VRQPLPAPTARPTMKDVATAAGAQADEQDVIAFCKERMAPYKYPREVKFLSALPVGPTGKILKKELRT